MSIAREAFVQKDAQTVREALTWLFHVADLNDLGYGLFEESIEKMGNDAMAALDRLEELATA